MSATQMLVVAWSESVVAAAVLLLLAWVAMRRIPQPVDRIRVIHCAFVAAIAAPACIVFSPLTLWRVEWVAPSAPVKVEAALTASTADSSPPSATLPSATTAVDDAAPDVSDPTAAMGLPDTATTGTVRSATATVPAVNSPDAWAIAAFVIVAVHAVAVLYFLAEWFVGVWRLRSLSRSARPAGDDMRRAWNSLTGDRGRHVRLLVSTEVDTPLAFGWRRPTIVIPQTVAAENSTSLNFCLAHEWSHLDRGDLGSWWLTWLCQYWLWCQPLFWMLRRELRISQDMLADDRATAAGRDAIAYSELLVGFARRQLSPPVMGAMGFLDQPSQLSRRVTMLLESRGPLRSQCSRRGALAAALAASFVVAMISGVRLEATPAVSPGIQTSPPTATEKPAEEKPPPAAAEKGETLRYTGMILDKETGQGIPGATVIVRRSILPPSQITNTIIEESKHTTDAAGKYTCEIPPEQVAERYLYIELDVEHENYAAQKGFGYALSMIRKNEALGERPFFERVELLPADPVTGTVVSPDGRPLSGVKILGYSQANANNFKEFGSFFDTITDASGKFRLNMVKGGAGVFWVLPKDFAITSRAVGKDRGDVGEIRLREGVRVSGRVLNVEGKPVAGVPVNIEYRGGGDETVNNLPVASSIRRGAMTDDNGAFSFDPLPSGDYRVLPEDHKSDPLERDRTRYTLPGVFLPMKVSLKEGAAVPPIEVQASPHVVFNAQYFDSAGKTTRGHSFFLFGRLDGESWFGQGRPDDEGTVALKVPHGLQNVRVQLSTNEHGTLRYRRGKDQKLENREVDIEFGTLNDDVNGFEIIRYRAPLVLVAAVDEAQNPIKDFRVTATYPWGQQRYVQKGELRSDINFEHQNDGRYRTKQMLPDEEVTFTVTAPGYATATEKVTLPEGESKELVVTLKTATDTKPE